MVLYPQVQAKLRAEYKRLRASTVGPTHGGGRRRETNYNYMLQEPDPVTGMWTVTAELDEDGERVVGVIHIDSIIRACHLIGFYGNATIPLDFDYSDSLDAFHRFYVSWYSDYHAHEILL